MLIRKKQWEELSCILYRILEEEKTETVKRFRIYLGQYTVLEAMYPEGRLNSERDEKRYPPLRERLDRAGCYLALAPITNNKDACLQLFYLVHWLIEEGEYVPYASMDNRVVNILQRVIAHLLASRG
jgi:hypothetical protein